MDPARSHLSHGSSEEYLFATCKSKSFPPTSTSNLMCDNSFESQNFFHEQSLGDQWLEVKYFGQYAAQLRSKRDLHKLRVWDEYIKAQRRKNSSSILAIRVDDQGLPVETVFENSNFYAKKFSIGKNSVEYPINRAYEDYAHSKSSDFRSENYSHRVLMEDGGKFLQQRMVTDEPVWNMSVMQKNEIFENPGVNKSSDLQKYDNLLAKNNAEITLDPKLASEYASVKSMKFENVESKSVPEKSQNWNKNAHLENITTAFLQENGSYAFQPQALQFSALENLSQNAQVFQSNTENQNSFPVGNSHNEVEILRLQIELQRLKSKELAREIEASKSENEHYVEQPPGLVFEHQQKVPSDSTMEHDSRFIEISSTETDASLENLVNGNFDLKEESSCTVGTQEYGSSLASELKKNSGVFNFGHPVELKRDPLYNSVTAENSGLIDAPYVAFVSESTAKIVNRTKFLAFEVDDVQGMVNFCAKTKLSKRVEQVAYFMPQDDCYLPNVLELLVKLCEFFGKFVVNFLVIPPPPMIHTGYEKVIDFLLANGTIVQPKKGRSFLEIGWIGNRICTKDVANGEWTQMGLRKVQCFLYEIKGIAAMKRQIFPNESKGINMKANIQGQKPKISFPKKPQTPVTATAPFKRTVVEKPWRNRSKENTRMIGKRNLTREANESKISHQLKQARLDINCRTMPRVSQHFYNPMRQNHRNSDHRFSCFGRRGQFSNHILEYVVPSYCGFPYAWMMEFYRYGRKKPFRDRVIEIW